MRNTFGFQGYTTAERDTLTAIEAGTCIFNTTTIKLNLYTGTAWVEITSADEV